MRWFIIFAILLLVAGGGYLRHAQSYPIYSDPEAPGRISDELQSFPRETRFHEWHARLHSFETPYKRLSDLGRGLCAAGVALLAAVGFWGLYHRSVRVRGFAILLILWSCLWLIRIPLTYRYYILRAQRFDYPIWGDSIAIPVVSETLAWLIGAVVTSIVLRLLLLRHSLPNAIRLVRPASPYGWFRGVGIACWLLALIACVVFGVLDGDEGSVISSMGASVILLAFLSAPELRPSDETTNTAV